MAPAFDYGPEREAYERVWSDDVRTALILASSGPHSGRLQRFLMDRVTRLLDEWARDGRPITSDTVPSAVASTLASLEHR